jgi:hypothetical protein
MQKITIHRDHTISYFSVLRQSHVSRARHVSDAELATMPSRDRDRVIAAMAAGDAMDEDLTDARS